MTYYCLKSTPAQDVDKDIECIRSITIRPNPVEYRAPFSVLQTSLPIGILTQILTLKNIERFEHRTGRHGTIWACGCSKRGDA